ncbi:MAG: UDP-N-acetylmuramoyl-L-alanine--D-glutamate ligase [Chitinivibrionales bacterium]|nr:UDP-N-acetylmuramoyl-L-alanine--D-glutamate ligase [Chitinivibrionales bacterium]
MTEQQTGFTLPRKVSILGAGKSGMAAARYLSKRNIDIFVSDTCSMKDLDFRLAANELAHVPHEAQEHTEKVLVADLIVLSPGIAADIPLLQTARKKGIAVWSEIELAYRVCKPPIVAVTGSTGKSTTVGLLHSMVQKSDRQSVLAGNIGFPAISQLPKLPPDGLGIVEMSSFQLETIVAFKPKIAAITNILKNHLDRYRSEKEYFSAKKRIIMNMGPDDYLLLNLHDVKLRRWAEDLGSKVQVVYFGDKPVAGDCCWIDGDDIWCVLDGTRAVAGSLKQMQLSGNHNRINACAAALMAHLSGISPNAVSEGIAAFGGLEHRMEFVAEKNGIAYYNDSKSTTAESIREAVGAFGNRRIYLIAGGKDKGCDFSVVNKAVQAHVKKVLTIGEASRRIIQTWSNLTLVEKSPTLEEAVRMASQEAQAGDVVILSPGCSSFDMFCGFEERGRVFKDAVLTIRENAADA